ncbi:MAG: hypothetical protein KatS3mg044_0464 [Rhodothermaceae bacterium]|nr:MAG: hypothetical protein KatS3mg044_0464 [Rhodothermaceae bacterium]
MRRRSRAWRCSLRSASGGGGQQDDRRLGVGQEPELVGDRVGVFDAPGVAQENLVAALAVEDERAGGHGPVEGQRVQRAVVEAQERLRDVLAAGADLHGNFGAGQGRHVAHVGFEAPGGQARVGRKV